MTTQCLSFLYAFDLLSFTPQLRIFNHSTYSSTFSLILTIIIFLFSIGISLYLLIDYFRFDSPFIVYTKENDKITNRTLKLKDTFFIFGFQNYFTLEPLKSEAFYTGVYAKYFFNGTVDAKTPLTLEICEFGKNINMKYKTLFEENKILEIYNSTISDYYCISSKHENLTISYLPKIGEYSFVIMPHINSQSLYVPELIVSLIITEQDLIDHNNRNKPFNYYYALKRTPNYSSKEYTTINFNLQYIKYETDTKLFLKNYEKREAKTFVNMEYFKDYSADYDYETYPLGQISICMLDFFDNYKRSYEKLQALLAQILTIIHLLFVFGQKICDVLLSKRMAKDIVGNLFKHKEFLYEMNQQDSSISNNINEIIIRDNKKENISLDSGNIKDKTLSENAKLDLNVNFKIRNDSKKKEIENKIIYSKKIEKINNFDIFKSFFCYKNKTTKLINKCCNIINNDICVENILKKIYELENIYFILSRKKQNRVKMCQYSNKRFKEVDHLINLMHIEEQFKNKKSEQKTRKRNTVV